MPKICMYEGCDAPEHRKSGYCIKHTESGPRSILINTSKFVNEEPSDDVKVEFVKEEENEEEALPEIEEKVQEEEIKVEKKLKLKKKDKVKIGNIHNQIILPVKPNSGNTILAISFICIVSFMFIVSGDDDIICSTCCISGFLIFGLSNIYSSKKLDYQNACVDKIEKALNRMDVDTEIPKEPSVLTRIFMYVFGFLAIVCLFDDDTFGWSFIWAVVWFLCYISYNGDIQKRNDFIDLYR